MSLRGSSDWGIENSPHWQLDLNFDEDRNRARKDHAAANLAVLRRIALSLLKKETSSQGGVKNRRLTAAWSTDYLHKVLFGKVFTVQSPCIQGRNTRGRRIQTRPVKAVAKDIEINRKLWALAENYANT